MRFVALAIVSLMGACEYIAPPTIPQQEQRCADLPPGAQKIAWRDFAPPVGCPPEMPNAAFPIRDEAAFRAAFPCAGSGPDPTGIDFASERLEAIPIPGAFGGEPRISWFARRGDALMVRVALPPQCGGAQAGKTPRLFVVPRDAPVRVFENSCTIGTCPNGPGRPP